VACKEICCSQASHKLGAGKSPSLKSVLLKTFGYIVRYW
jgi:hypothetical protein